MSTPEPRKSATPQPSISHLRTNSRSSSRGSRRSRSQEQDEYKESLQVYLHDCQHLVRRGSVGLPGGFTKSGNPLLFFPDKAGFSNVSEGDLHLLLKYFISVVPRADQSPGFALVIDRRRGSWQEVQVEFDKIITLFPAKIKEVFLLYQYPEDNPDVCKLLNEYLHDFDIFHVAHATELLHYIDAKYLSAELGGSNPVDVDTWMVVQQNVDAFTVSATKCAKRMGTFVKILNKEDISIHKNRDTIREVAERNRGIYRRLRTELESLAEGGVYLGRKMQENGANIMQRLAVDIMCNQLDETWNYFTTTFKMQDRIYVQFVELYQFENEFRELVNKFSENGKIINRLIMSGFGNSLEEINKELDEIDNVINALSVDVMKAKTLIRSGKELMMEHPFTRESLEFSCAELKVMCKKQEILFLERRRPLIKFYDMYEALDNISEWCESATKHLKKEEKKLVPKEEEEETKLLETEENNLPEKEKPKDGEKPKEVEGQEEDVADVLSELRQLEFLMSRARDIKIRGREDFEEDFVEIKDLVSEKTIVIVDEHITKLEEVKKKVSDRRDILRQKAPEEKVIDDACSVDITDRKEKILEELISTEVIYVDDLQTVLTGYRDKIATSNTKIATKSPMIFGNMDEIYNFHSQNLLPELERCGRRADQIAEIFLENSQQLTRIYCRYCQNMDDAHAAVTDVGENHPLLASCQKELGHQLPLSSYLLKPVQRLTKYQLLLKDLLSTSSSAMNGHSELEESIEAILSVIKVVNDSMHQGNVRGLPEVLHPLGSLVCQENFSVLTENKSQPSHIFRNRRQPRQVLLYDSQLVFCKQTNEKRGPIYHFKFSLAIGNLGMSSIIKGAEKKMEIWIIGQSDVYSLEAKNKKAKEDFAAELRKVIIEQKDKIAQKPNRMPQSGMYNEHISGSGSEELRSRRSNYSCSRSLEHDNETNEPRSQSLDIQHERRPGCEGENMDYSEQENAQYRVLADYTALSGRELTMHEGEIVELVTVGFAGWWFVRLASYPDTEGWAPQTYLEKIPSKYRTLDRK